MTELDLAKKRRKIALIGAGQIGGVAALLAAQRRLGDILLYDVVAGLPQGKALDLKHALPLWDTDVEISGSNEIAAIAGADVCLVTSGMPRKPGMSRDDLLRINAEIIGGIGQAIGRYAPEALVVVVTNPLDLMTGLLQRVGGLPTNRVVGMAGLLDSARYRAFLAEALAVSAGVISALVLGGHGDDMVPIRSHTTCAGIPVGRLLAAQQLDAIEERVRGAGAEVLGLLKSGSAYFSPAAAAVQMIESYLHDRRQLLPAAAYCQGEYGLRDIYVGVPIVLGAAGAERIVEIELSAPERQALHASAERIRRLAQQL